MNQAYLIDAVRTPIGNHCGALSPIRADDLAALPLAALLVRNKTLPPEAIDDVVLGCANQAGEDNRNVARMASLLAGYPQSVPGQTVNRLCASGLAAATDVCQRIQAGGGDIFVAGGVEQMTRAPWVMGKPATAFSRTPEVFDTSIGWRFINPKMKELFGVDSMGQTAENVAEQYNLTREEQDLFALASQQKATAARTAGRFTAEILPVTIPQGKGASIQFSEDEFIRPGTTLEVLAKLKPAFRTDGKGTVTAGNSSGINDGAAALLFASESATKKYNLKPIARFVAAAAAGVAPRVMGIGPVPAVQKVLAMAKLSLSDISVIELNEAFAAQSIAVLRDLGLAANDPRVNPNGGAIALGHPLGMSGARLLQTAAIELQRTGGKYALCTMCIGVGQGMAAIIERV